MFELNLDKIKKLINKLIKKFINNLNKNTVIIYIRKNFLKILLYLLIIVFVGYCYIYLSFDDFNASNIYYHTCKIIYIIKKIFNKKVNVIDLSKECFLSMQKTYPIFDKKSFWRSIKYVYLDYRHVCLTDIFSKSFYPRHLEHVKKLMTELILKIQNEHLDYLYTERVIQIFAEKEFNNSKVVTVFIEKIQVYNDEYVNKLMTITVRHVITTNKEYNRCLYMYKLYNSIWSNYFDMTSITSDDEKFLFVQDRIKWECLEEFTIEGFIKVYLDFE